MGNNEHISRFSLAMLTALSFMLGAFCSALAGAVGVWISVRCNVRVSSAAARNSTADALKLAFCGGAVSSIISAAMCILGISLLYSLLHLIFVWGGAMPAHMVPLLLVGYGFGASFVALFMQLGGGIYTKAADVGGDLVGKIESNIPEDDHRNPATIADLVGCWVLVCMPACWVLTCAYCRPIAKERERCVGAQGREGFVGRSGVRVAGKEAGEREERGISAWPTATATDTVGGVGEEGPWACKAACVQRV